MAKVIVYNVYTQALETFYLEENDPMPYAYDRTMLVREFRGSSRSSVLWTTNAAMEAWNATRRQSVTESGILRTILVSGFMWSLFT